MESKGEFGSRPLNLCPCFSGAMSPSLENDWFILRHNWTFKCNSFSFDRFAPRLFLLFFFPCYCSKHTCDFSDSSPIDASTVSGYKEAISESNDMRKKRSLFQKLFAQLGRDEVNLVAKSTRQKFTRKGVNSQFRSVYFVSHPTC